MNLLEARYHPAKRREEFIVVGHVLCDGSHASILRSDGRKETVAPPELLSHLKHLVSMRAPRPFDGLRALDNAFWSFVGVSSLSDVAHSNDT